VGLRYTRVVGKMGEVDMTIPPTVVVGVARVLLPGSERDIGELLARSHGMDGIREFLSAVRDAGLAGGHFLGLLHIAIGRRVTRPDGTVVSTGITWRVLSAELKNLRFDQELVREYGADPDDLVARDRERFWYSAIAVAKVDSSTAVAEAEKLIPLLEPLGFLVSPPPGGIPPTALTAPKAKAKPEPKVKAKEKDKEADKDDKPGKKKK